MQTKNNFVDNDDFDPEEAMEAAVEKRKFLIKRLQSINQSKNLFKNTQSFQHELISKRGVYLSRYY